MLAMTAPKRKPGRPRGRKKTVPYQLRILPELAAALDDYIASRRPRTSANAVLEAFVEDSLTRAGFWPRKKPPDESQEDA